MHMSLTPEVTHVICERCDCHAITIEDVTVAVTAAEEMFRSSSTTSECLIQTPFQLFIQIGFKTATLEVYFLAVQSIWYIEYSM